MLEKLLIFIVYFEISRSIVRGINERISWKTVNLLRNFLEEFASRSPLRMYGSVSWGVPLIIFGIISWRISTLLFPCSNKNLQNRDTTSTVICIYILMRALIVLVNLRNIYVGSRALSIDCGLNYLKKKRKKKIISGFAR